MSVFLVIYHQGTEAGTAVVIGLDRGGSPHILDQLDAAWIAVGSDEDQLELDPEPGSNPSKKCLHRNGSALKLEAGRCPG